MNNLHIANAGSGVGIYPNWPAPATVLAVTTTRQGGCSAPPYESFNLAMHVGDNPQTVAANRACLHGVPNTTAWLNQTHGTTCTRLPGAEQAEADAAWTNTPGQVCAVLTADCLPVLFCDRRGTRVAAAHAGWRGLAAGVLEATVAAMDCAPADLLAWLGPAIGPQRFEVGAEVRAAFTDRNPATHAAFRAHHRPGHWLADLYAIARLNLRQVGVTAVYGGDFCTYSEPQRFFSFRRDGVTGRMASLIWLAE